LCQPPATRGAATPGIVRRGTKRETGPSDSHRSADLRGNLPVVVPHRGLHGVSGTGRPHGRDGRVSARWALAPSGRKSSIKRVFLRPGPPKASLHALGESLERAPSRGKARSSNGDSPRPGVERDGGRPGSRPFDASAPRDRRGVPLGSRCRRSGSAPGARSIPAKFGRATRETLLTPTRRGGNVQRRLMHHFWRSRGRAGW